MYRETETEGGRAVSMESCRLVMVKSNICRADQKLGDSGRCRCGLSRPKPSSGRISSCLGTSVFFHLRPSTGWMRPTHMTERSIDLNVHVTFPETSRPVGLVFVRFLPCYLACEILVLHPGIELGPSAVKAQSPNYWAIREVPAVRGFFKFIWLCCLSCSTQDVFSRCTDSPVAMCGLQSSGLP